VQYYDYQNVSETNKTVYTNLNKHSDRFVLVPVA